MDSTKKNYRENRKNIVVLMVTLILVVAIVFGLSYAWLRLTKSSNTVNKITAGNLELVLDDTTSEGIKLVNEVPRSYKQGMETKEYTFTLTNKNSTSNYSLSLKDLEKYTDEDGKEIVVAAENRINDSKIRYILLKDGEESSADKSKILTDRIIDSGTIEKGQTVSYSLRLWIDSHAETEVMGKIFNARLSLVAEQSSNSTEVKPLAFATDPWDVISKAVKENNYPYQVGDTKEIDMGSLGTHTVRVANTSSCTNGETSETACGFVVEFADIISEQSMNSPSTNVGGWPASAMRTYVNGTIYNALPSDLQNVIATTTVVSSHGSTSGETNFTSSDKLYLLSTKEVWGKDGTSNAINGVNGDTAEAETRQLDYYKNNGVTTDNDDGAIKQYNGINNTYWWLRSADSAGTYSFFLVYIYGAWNTNYAYYTYGVSPAFRIA